MRELPGECLDVTVEEELLRGGRKMHKPLNITTLLEKVKDCQMPEEQQPAISCKDQSIRSFLAMLQSAIGEEKYQIVDHWEASLVCIGIARLDDPGTLVYVTTWNQPESRYGYECEVPSGDPEDFPYQVVAEGDGVEFGELVEIIRKHLRI